MVIFHGYVKLQEGNQKAAKFHPDMKQIMSGNNQNTMEPLSVAGLSYQRKLVFPRIGDPKNLIQFSSKKSSHSDVLCWVPFFMDTAKWVFPKIGGVPHFYFLWTPPNTSMENFSMSGCLFSCCMALESCCITG
jgi:hypothetical protein